MSKTFHEALAASIYNTGGCPDEVHACLRQSIRLIKSMPVPDTHDGLKEAILNRTLDLARVRTVDTEGVIEYIDREKRRVCGEQASRRIAAARVG